MSGGLFLFKPEFLSCYLFESAKVAHIITAMIFSFLLLFFILSSASTSSQSINNGKTIASYLDLLLGQ